MTSIFKAIIVTALITAGSTALITSVVINSKTEVTLTAEKVECEPVVVDTQKETLKRAEVKNSPAKAY